MQMNQPMSLSSSDYDVHCSDPDDFVDQSTATIGFDFDGLTIDCNDDDDDSSSQKLLPDLEIHEDCEHEEEEEDDDDDDGDFTFMYIGDNDSPVSADQVFKDGQIRSVFPLFDQKLLLDGEYEVEEIDRLPVLPPVDNVFIESPHRSPSSTASEHEENDGAAAGPYCDWSKQSAELSKKSNSTGFSKLWRLKDIVGRSNSDGRDAFVFLKCSDKTPATDTTSTSAKPAGIDRSFVKVNVAGGKARVVKRGTPAKKATVSAHEAYLKSKEDNRRRSYLPYRPELMGFFTNVNGGLSKNVHPY